MSRVRLRAIALSAPILLVLCASAEAQVRGTIFGPGTRQYPIAVSEAKNLTSGAVSSQGISLLADVISRDLELAGLFRPVPRSAYIERPDTSGITAETINFDNWSVIGALALVKGSVASERVSDAALDDRGAGDDRGVGRRIDGDDERALRSQRHEFHVLERRVPLRRDDDVFRPAHRRPYRRSAEHGHFPLLIAFR